MLKFTSTYPTSVWNGTTPSRDDPNSLRAPDWQDYKQLEAEILAIQNQMYPLCIGADGALRASPGAGVNEVQNLAQIASTSGNWKLTFTVPGSDAVTTANLAFDINAAELETAINVAATAAGVTGWTNGDISVSGAADINAGALVLTFDGTSVSKQPIAACSTTDVDLNDSTPPVVSETTAGVLPSAVPAKTWYKGVANAVTVG